MAKMQREAELWKAEKIRQLEMQIYIERTLLSHMRQELKELRNLRGSDLAMAYGWERPEDVERVLQPRKQLESLLRKGTAQ